MTRRVGSRGLTSSIRRNHFKSIKRSASYFSSPLPRAALHTRPQCAAILAHIHHLKLGPRKCAILTMVRISCAKESASSVTSSPAPKAICWSKLSTSRSEGPAAGIYTKRSTKGQKKLVQYEVNDHCFMRAGCWDFGASNSLGGASLNGPTPELQVVLVVGRGAVGAVEPVTPGRFTDGSRQRSRSWAVAEAADDIGQDVRQTHLLEGRLVAELAGAHLREE